MIQQEISDLGMAIANVDDWLETMWGPSGYTGPIAHWWESNLLFTGPLYDWRYEGIIDGYRMLFQKTGQPKYLGKAIRAADAVVGALLPDGRYRNSSFQFGPVAGGTPHEAALDVALFLLASDLGDVDPERAQRYQEVGLKNIEKYWLGALWNGKGFSDQPDNPVLVANKHGTLLEALAGAHLLNGPWKRCVDACVKVILSAQVLDGPQSGGTIHRGIGPSKLAVPIYTARAMNGLLSLYEKDPRPEIKEAVLRSVPFFERTMGSRGVVWGLYADGGYARFPEMIAGAGDVLRFMWRVQQLGWSVSVNGMVDQLLASILKCQQPSGAFPTGYGFARKGRDREPMAGDVRDVLPVVGWVDKTFRALALMAPANFGDYQAAAKPCVLETHWKGHRVIWEETRTEIQIRRGSHVMYRWEKGEWAPAVYAL